MKKPDQYPPDPDFGWITDKAGFEYLVANVLVFWPANPKTGNPRKTRFLYEASDLLNLEAIYLEMLEHKQAQG